MENDHTLGQTCVAHARQEVCQPITLACETFLPRCVCTRLTQLPLFMNQSVYFGGKGTKTGTPLVGFVFHVREVRVDHPRPLPAGLELGERDRHLLGRHWCQVF